MFTKFVFYPTDAQLNIPRKILKFMLKFTLKVLLHVLVQSTIIREHGNKKKKHVRLFCVLYDQRAKKRLGIRFNITFHYHSLDRHPPSSVIQGVPGGMDKTSGECSLCRTIPI